MFVLTKTRIREVRSALSGLGFRNHVKELSERVRLGAESRSAGEYSLNYVLWRPDDHDLSEICEPEQFAGQKVQDRDGVIVLDFWLYEQQGDFRELITNAYVTYRRNDQGGWDMTASLDYPEV